VSETASAMASNSGSSRSRSRTSRSRRLMARYPFRSGRRAAARGRARISFWPPPR
jgi:hypothetical protein